MGAAHSIDTMMRLHRQDWDRCWLLLIGRLSQAVMDAAAWQMELCTSSCMFAPVRLWHPASLTCFHRSGVLKSIKNWQQLEKVKTIYCINPKCLNRRTPFPCATPTHCPALWKRAPWNGVGVWGKFKESLLFTRTIFVSAWDAENTHSSPTAFDSGQLSKGHIEQNRYIWKHKTRYLKNKTGQLPYWGTYTKNLLYLPEAAALNLTQSQNKLGFIEKAFILRERSSKQQSRTLLLLQQRATLQS